MPDLSDIRIEATADVRWPDDHPRASENPDPPTDDEQDTEPQKEPEE